MITLDTSGDFSNTERFLARMRAGAYRTALESYAQEGVTALSNATPVRTGLAASSWYYEVEIRNGGMSIYWCNRNTEGGPPVVILIQYGHGTRNGGLVSGEDFINPAIRPVFDSIADKVWRVVKNS